MKKHTSLRARIVYDSSATRRPVIAERQDFQMSGRLFQDQRQRGRSPRPSRVDAEDVFLRSGWIAILSDSSLPVPLLGKPRLRSANRATCPLDQVARFIEACG